MNTKIILMMMGISCAVSVAASSHALAHSLTST